MYHETPTVGTLMPPTGGGRERLPNGHELSVLLTHYGLVALFLLAFVKAIGVPIPIPADVVVIVAATGSASGKFVPWQAFAVLVVAMVVGACIQFALARGPGRSVLFRFGPHFGLTPQRLDIAFQRVQNVGVLGIGVAVVTPGIRTAAIPACGLTKIPVKTYVAGLSLGTTVYITFQFFVGYGIVKLLLGFWNTEGHAWLLLGVAPLLCVLAWMSRHHAARHIYQPEVPEINENGLRSSWCPLCWLTRFGDLISHRSLHPTRKRSSKDGSRSIAPPIAPKHSIGVEAQTSELRRPS